MVFGVVSALRLNEREWFPQVGRSLKHRERSGIGDSRIPESFEIESLVHLCSLASERRSG
jgi:hypothetical protein